MIRLVALLMVYVFAVIDATLLPRACRKHLKSLFIPLFDSLEAKLLAIVRAPATIAPAQPTPTTTKTTQPAKQAVPTRPTTARIPSAPPPASAPTENSPIAEAPPPKRAPAPHHPTRAPHRAVTPPTISTRPNPENLQKTAFTNPLSHAHFVAIS